MKIAIVTQGRFEVFDLAIALIRRGHDVRVLINYPGWAVKRFGLDPKRAWSFWLHGLLQRFFERICRWTKYPYPEPFMSRLFGGWASRRLEANRWDAILIMSGVAEEALKNPRVSGTKILIRASSHIRAQHRILSEEEARTGMRIEKPSEWMIRREENEYSQADTIRVPSNFARQTFLDLGFPESKAWLHRPISYFQKPGNLDEILNERVGRILSGRPLNVLYVGNVCAQKGMFDLRAIASDPNMQKHRFRLVGEIQNEVCGLFTHHKNICLMGKVPQNELVKDYMWADLFLFPTLQDGFGVVLLHAHLYGLPALTTTNSGGPEFIQEGKTGWIFPIRRPDLIAERLRWCDEHRKELARLISEFPDHLAKARTWEDAAHEAEEYIQALLASKNR